MATHHANQPHEAKRTTQQTNTNLSNQEILTSWSKYFALDPRKDPSHTDGFGRPLVRMFLNMYIQTLNSSGPSHRGMQSTTRMNDQQKRAMYMTVCGGLLPCTGITLRVQATVLALRVIITVQAGSLLK